MIYHESDEELHCGSFKSWHKFSSIPENKGDNSKRLSLWKSIQKICPNGALVRLLKRLIQAFAVQSKAVIFSSQWSDGTDRTSCFTSQLCGFCMGLFVNLIFQNYNTLQFTSVSAHNNRWSRNLPAECNPTRPEVEYMLIVDYELVKKLNFMVNVPIPIRPTFQTKARPRTEPAITHAILWIMVPSVTPANPLTFCGSSLSWAVKAPVCNAIKNVYTHQKSKRSLTLLLSLSKNSTNKTWTISSNNEFLISHHLLSCLRMALKLSERSLEVNNDAEDANK